MEKNYEKNERNERNEMNDPQENDSISLKGFLVGAFIGGIIGAATAIFLTPKSGKDLRENLNDQATLLKDKTYQLSETALNKGNDFANLAKEKASAFTHSMGYRSTFPLGEAKDLKSFDDFEGETQYISIKDTVNHTFKSSDDVALSDDQDVRKKLEEAKKAFDDVESKIKH